MVTFERWSEESDCSLQCVFHFENKERADEFLKKQHTGASTKAGQVWRFLIEGKSFGDNAEESPSQEGKE